ncbi:MAG TPA: 5'/3'-nucleotidase SurE [Gammaproteobacteria bacterium]|nr:5'/3'-nucleotidase SurE [Gammaproteobacteria bacterium]
MKILLSNDDGFRAPGLRCLAQELAKTARIIVVTPDRNRSGASNSLTLDMPLRMRREDDEVICVEGTPTDCVHLALTGMLDEDDPDMVVSGINDGANLGDDVLYSGTVAAATEGRFLGLPAIAVSLVCGEEAQHYQTAAQVVVTLIEHLQASPLPADTLLNVNVPDLPWQELTGFAATRLGHRHRSEPVIPARDPRGRPIYWVGPAGPSADAGPGTDFYAVANNQVSITPLQVDLTRHAALENLSGWLEKGNLK